MSVLSMVTVDSNTPFDRPGGVYGDSGDLSPLTFGRYINMSPRITRILGLKKFGFAEVCVSGTVVISQITPSGKKLHRWEPRL